MQHSQISNGVNQKKRTRVGKTPAEKLIWTQDEVSQLILSFNLRFVQDDELRRLVDIYGDQAWHRLCKFMPNKTEIRCFKRWLYLKEISQNTPHEKKTIKQRETED